MAIFVTAIYENGVFRPLQEVDLSEHQKVRMIVQPAPEGALPTPIRETLADVLGFDPSDEARLRELGEQQRRAIMAIAGTARSGHTDISSNVDK